MNRDPCRTRPSRLRFSPPVLAGLGLTLLVLVFHVYMYRFLTDDAFISFRYAQNLSEGHGLVFNPGYERVEGYTNFLWVLLLALLGMAGISPPIAAHVLSLGATIGLWAVVVRYLAREYRRPGPAWPVLVPPLFLAATRSFAVWSTGGLETRLFDLLVVAGVLRLLRETRARIDGPPLRSMAPFLLGLAILTRPEGVLISITTLGAANLYLATRGKFEWRGFLRQVTPCVVIVVIHGVFRLAYYGDIVPNTYYAKVGGQSWWGMGLKYLLVFCLEYSVYLWLPLLGAALWRFRKDGDNLTPLIFAAAIVPHMVGVISVGGDHFEYRPFDFYFPLFFLALFHGARALARGSISTIITLSYLALVLLGLVIIPLRTHQLSPDRYIVAFPSPRESDSPFYRGTEKSGGDALFRLPVLNGLGKAYWNRLAELAGAFVGIRQEEHRMFLDIMIPEGQRLRRIVESGRLPADTHVAINSVGAVPYFSGLRILDRHGLTNREVAHSPVSGSNRAMAHDKLATPELGERLGVDLWATDHVHLLVHVSDPKLLKHLVEARNKSAVVARAGEGFYFVAVPSQGEEALRRRLPELHFQPLVDPDVIPVLVAEAIDHHRSWLQSHPKDYVKWFVLGDLFQFSGNPGEALSAYMTAMVHYERAPHFWIRLGMVYVVLGRVDEGIGAAERGLQLARDQGLDDMARKIQQRLLRYRGLPR